MDKILVEVMVMIRFIFEAADSAGMTFHFLLFIPTQPNEPRLTWKAAAGLFRSKAGKGFVLDGPEDQRGSILCAGAEDVTHFTVGNVLGTYDRSSYGYFRGVALKHSGKGWVYPRTAGSIKPGEFTWKLLVPMSPPT